MSCPGYTIRLEDGREICIPRYREATIWKKPDPDPKFSLFDDIDILVTIHDGVAHLANERLRKTLSEAIVGAARSLDLPKGVKLGDGLFKEQKAFMAAK